MHTCVERAKVENYIYIISQKSIFFDEMTYFIDETNIYPDKAQCKTNKLSDMAFLAPCRGDARNWQKIGGK